MVEDVPTILVTGGKGGTGKTLVSCNIAARLSLKGTVGVLDADIDSPNLPEVLGVSRIMEIDRLQNFVPVEVNPDLKIFSMNLVHEDSAKQGFSKSGDQNEQVIHDGLKYTSWGLLDWLIVDLPAGSSDEFRAILKRLNNIVGMVIVSLPNTITDLIRCVDLAGRHRIDVLGVVENMSRVICPHCQHTIPMYGSAVNTQVVELSAQLGVPYMGHIPYLAKLHRNGGNKFELPPENQTVLDRLMEVIDAAQPAPESGGLSSVYQSNEAVV